MSPQYREALSRVVAGEKFAEEREEGAARPVLREPGRKPYLSRKESGRQRWLERLPRDQSLRLFPRMHLLQWGKGDETGAGEKLAAARKAMGKGVPRRRAELPISFAVQEETASPRPTGRRVMSSQSQVDPAMRLREALRTKRAEGETATFDPTQSRKVVAPFTPEWDAELKATLTNPFPVPKTREEVLNTLGSLLNPLAWGRRVKGLGIAAGANLVTGAGLLQSDAGKIFNKPEWVDAGKELAANGEAIARPAAAQMFNPHADYLDRFEASLDPYVREVWGDRGVVARRGLDLGLDYYSNKAVLDPLLGGAGKLISGGKAVAPLAAAVETGVPAAEKATRLAAAAAKAKQVVDAAKAVAKAPVRSAVAAGGAGLKGLTSHAAGLARFSAGGATGSRAINAIDPDYRATAPGELTRKLTQGERGQEQLIRESGVTAPRNPDGSIAAAKLGNPGEPPPAGEPLGAGETQVAGVAPTQNKTEETPTIASHGMLAAGVPLTLLGLGGVLGSGGALPAAAALGGAGLIGAHYLKGRFNV